MCKVERTSVTLDTVVNLISCYHVTLCIHEGVYIDSDSYNTETSNSVVATSNYYIVIMIFV